MVPKPCRNLRKKLQPTIQLSCALLLTGCASSIDATKDVQSAQLLAKEHLPVAVDDSLTWNSPEPLTIDVAVAYALAHDALLQRDLAIVVQRRAEIAQAELPTNPTVSGAFGIAVDGLAGAPLILQGVQNLTWLWTRPGKIAAAEQSLQQAILSSANRTVEIVSNVRIAHFEATTNLQLLNLVIEDTAIAEEIVKVTRQHVRVGETSELQLDEVTLNLMESKHTLLEAQERFDLSLLKLLRAMGCPETMLAFPVTEQPKPALITYGENELFSYAIDNRLDLATKRARIEQRASELGIANPPLVSSSVMFNENFNDRQAILPGAGITIALDGEAKEAIADSVLHQAKLEYVDATRSAIHDVRTLYESYTSSVERYKVDRESHRIAEVSLQRALEASELGELHPLTLLPMQRRVIRTQQEILQDELQVSLLAIKLEQAVGGTFKGMNK